MTNENGEMWEELSGHLQPTVDSLNNSKELFLYKLEEGDPRQSNFDLKRIMNEEIDQHNAKAHEAALSLARQDIKGSISEGLNIANFKKT
jgi:hypothetical protein